METIKIRFIEENTKDGPMYSRQIKKWHGWIDQTFCVNLGYGGFCELYKGRYKEKLLEKVLEDKYKTVLKFVTILEYPSIKKY